MKKKIAVPLIQQDCFMELTQKFKHNHMHHAKLLLEDQSTSFKQPQMHFVRQVLKSSHALVLG